MEPIDVLKICTKHFPGISPSFGMVNEWYQKYTLRQIDTAAEYTAEAVKTGKCKGKPPCYRFNYMNLVLQHHAVRCP